MGVEGIWGRRDSRRSRPRGRFLLSWFVAGLTFLAAGRSSAQTSWKVTAGNWSDANCWTAGEPTLPVNALVNNAGTATIDSNGEACGTLYVGSVPGGSGAVQMTGGTLVASGNEDLGASGGQGVFTQTGGTNTVQTDLRVGVDSNGTYSLQGIGASLTVNGYAYLGYSGVGAFTQTGGLTRVFKSLYLGSNSVARGSYSLSDGNVTVGSSSYPEYIGRWGIGLFTQSGGMHSVLGALRLGDEPNASGTYQLQSGTLVVSGYAYAGFNGKGQVTQTGGNCKVNQEFNLGNGSGSSGTYELRDGNLTVGTPSYHEYIGRSGTGTFTQLAGIHSVLGSLYLGYNSLGAGTYQLLAGALTVNQGETVGLSGTGWFTQSGGSSILGTLTLGGNALGKGTYELKDGNLTISSTAYVGKAGTGTVTQTGGRNTVNLSLSLGNEPNSSGTYQLYGGSLRVGGADGEIIGNYGTGTFTQTGGDHSVSTFLYLGYDYRGKGTYELRDGNLTAGNPGYGVYLGKWGSGTFVQTWGRCTVNSYLYLGYEANGIGTYQLQNGSATVNYDEYLGLSGKGYFTQSSGNHTVKGAMFLAYFPLSKGTYELHDGNLTVGGPGLNEVVGLAQNASGTFTQSGGRHRVLSSLVVAQNTGSAGSYLLQNGSLIVDGNVLVGSGGTGTFTQTWGLCTVGSSLYLGNNPDSNGSYTLQDGNLTVASSLYVAFLGKGAFSQTGGRNTVSGALYLGYGANRTGTYELRNASLTVGSVGKGADTFIGYNGTGTFTHWSGTAVLNGMLYLGYQGASYGTYQFESGLLSSSAEMIGYWGRGTFTQTGGKHTIGGSLGVGCNPGSTGTYELRDGNLTVGLGKSEEMIGQDGNGTFIQAGGIHTVNCPLILGQDPPGRGTYKLQQGRLAVNYEEYIGYNGRGTFTQTGGNHEANSALYLGYNPGGKGTYELSAGNLTVRAFPGGGPAGEYIGYYGSGTFTQTGGNHEANSALYLGYNAGSQGTYELSDGNLTVRTLPWGPPGGEYIGHGGTGVFMQSGGRNTTTGSLFVGRYAGSSGTYELNGTGRLSADSEYVGATDCNGLFRQGGGTNSTAYLFIGALGRYEFTGGALNVASGLHNEGTLDFEGNSVALDFSAGNAIVNLSKGITLNAASASLTIGPNSVLIVPPGFDPNAAFGFYSNAGLFHEASGTLTVPAGQGFSGCGQIDDHVECQGFITAAPGRFIHLNTGLMVSGGFVDLGTGTLTVENTISGITGSSLSCGTQWVGKTGTGVFTQTGGTVASSWLYIGYEANSMGTYDLQDGNLVVSSGEYIALAGTGAFTQSGGRHRVIFLYLGTDSNSTGTYDLQGGNLVVSMESIGEYGKGAFTQGGGTHTVDLVYIGYEGISSGTYDLQDGNLVVSSLEYIALNGTGAFTQSGGTHTVNGSLYLGYFGGSSGTYTQTGGTVASSLMSIAQELNSTGTYELEDGNLVVGTEYIGWRGTGAFRQGGGTHKVDGLFIGYVGGSSGAYAQTGGTVSDGTLFIGYEANSTGTYNLQDGNLAVSSVEYIALYGTGAFTQGGGTHTVNGSLYLGYYAGSSGTYDLDGGTLEVDANLVVGVSGIGALNLGGGTLGGDGKMFVTAGKGTVRGHGQIDLLTVNNGSLSAAGGTLRLTKNLLGAGSAAVEANAVLVLSAGGGKVLRCGSLSLDANGAILDLNDNDMIIDYPDGNTPIDQVSEWIRSAFNGGDWSGNGITSTATADPNYGGLAGIGFADNAAGLTGEFSGQTVDDSCVLVKFTWYGDADLNGAVNTDDFGLWVAGFSGDPGTSQTWLYGDFDYNGAVNTDDFALWAYAFDGQTGVLGEGLGSPVPEPGLSSLLVLGALGVVLRRRGFAQVVWPQSRGPSLAFPGPQENSQGFRGCTKTREG